MSEGNGFVCPHCGQPVACSEAGLPEHRECPECRALLWCRLQPAAEATLLSVVPGCQPDLRDMTTVGHALAQSQRAGRLIVSLRGLQTVNSSFIAGLLALHRLIASFGGQLVLCELHPHVRMILARLNLQMLLRIDDSLADALRTA